MRQSYFLKLITPGKVNWLPFLGIWLIVIEPDNRWRVFSVKIYKDFYNLLQIACKLDWVAIVLSEPPCANSTLLLYHVLGNSPILLYIMYNISAFLQVPARNKMYEGADRGNFLLLEPVNKRRRRIYTCYG